MVRKTRFLPALALAGAMLWAAPAHASVLRVCADPNNMPFSNAQREGFENRIIERVAQQMGATVEYVWRAQRRGYVRESLNGGQCDVLPGVAADLETVLTTRPYYRSTYVFLWRADRNFTLLSLDDPVLARLIIGVQMVGDDFSNTPPAHALMRRGYVDNVRGYMIYGDYGQPAPAANIVRAVASGEVDAAIVWGPLAGYFANRAGAPLRLAPVEPALDPRMQFDIAMGVRRGDTALRDQLNAALEAQRVAIQRILSEYSVPQVAGPVRAAPLR